MDLDRIQVYWIRINADLDAHPGFFWPNILIFFFNLKRVQASGIGSSRQEGSSNT